MYLARIRRDSPDGVEARIVVSSDGAADHWVDVRLAQRLRLEARGATTSAARTISSALVPGSLATALEGGDAFVEALQVAADDTSGDAVAPEKVRLLAPIDPPAFRDFMSFEQHFVTAHSKSGRPVPEVLYELPVSYMGSAQAFIGPEDEVPWPGFTRHMDYELELGIVVGRGGRDLTPEEALGHVLGLTILNDFSARDIQLREMSGGLGPSKGKHFASAVGPRIVTLESIPASGLSMEARVNGDVWSRGSTASMMWSIGELVAWASAGEPLVAGTLLGSGTVGGGCGFELGRSLSPGDLVELEIERLGVLRNQIGIPSPNSWEPDPRTWRVEGGEVAKSGRR
jgi:2-keto-4-pentenoate hydratase/2-oxohepta-3-ene-1,7-dioic acid hydratase in catechol pathway